MALRQQLEQLEIGHPLTIMAKDDRGYSHDLKATFQGLTKHRVKIQYHAGKVDSHVSLRRVIIRRDECTWAKFSTNKSPDLA